MIEGGIPYLIKSKQKLLVSAYVTNTRLMGVLALYAHWRISGTDEMLDFHQFFYIDCEESGLEPIPEYWEAIILRSMPLSRRL